MYPEFERLAGDNEYQGNFRSTTQAWGCTFAVRVNSWWVTQRNHHKTIHVASYRLLPASALLSRACAADPSNLASGWRATCGVVNDLGSL